MDHSKVIQNFAMHRGIRYVWEEFSSSHIFDIDDISLFRHHPLCFDICAQVA